MSSMLLHRLELLSSTWVPQLVASVVICEAAVLIVSNHHLATMAFILQRSAVTILMWPLIGPLLTRMNAVALGPIGLVFGISVFRLRPPAGE